MIQKVTLTEDTIMDETHKRPFEVGFHQNLAIRIEFEIADIAGCQTSGFITESNQITGKNVQLGMRCESLGALSERVVSFGFQCN